ncbi:hypothetical protein C8R45DRAFT_1103764 [Mycena sanguinolenta]|nr:hypothetical protein C8R45DRAFT_1103764 [Mycena sanguinolenta]
MLAGPMRVPEIKRERILLVWSRYQRSTKATVYSPSSLLDHCVQQPVFKTVLIAPETSASLSVLHASVLAPRFCLIARTAIDFASQIRTHVVRPQPYSAYKKSCWCWGRYGPFGTILACISGWGYEGHAAQFTTTVALVRKCCPACLRSVHLQHLPRLGAFQRLETRVLLLFTRNEKTTMGLQRHIWLALDILPSSPASLLSRLQCSLYTPLTDAALGVTMSAVIYTFEVVDSMSSWH